MRRSLALLKDDIKLVLVAFNHSPRFPTIKKNSLYTRFKNLQLGVYAELTVSLDVL